MDMRLYIAFLLLLTALRMDGQDGAGILSTVDTTAGQSEVILSDSLVQDTLPNAEKAVLPESRTQALEPQSEMVKYTPGFEFQDGIFPNFDMVKANTPIPPARIHTDLDMYDRAFYEKLTSGKEIVIYDQNGVKKVLKTNNIWGYGRNGSLYINVGSAFHRISFVGNISHFVASVTTYNPNYYDPYYYNPYSPYYNSYNRYDMNRSSYTTTDLRQYLLDFETGEVMEYTTESVGILLMKDPELADEFQALRNRKQKQMKFVYIRRYNERHPLYLPSR